MGLCKNMKFHPKAIFFGVLTDLGLTVIASVVLFLVGIGSTNPALYAWSLILGLAAVCGGGYVTARSGPTSKMFNSGLYGVVEVLIGIAVALFSPLIPLWFHIASFILVLPAALLGAYFVAGIK